MTGRLLALIFPALAGIGWLVLAGAPQHYPLVNAGAALAGIPLIAAGARWSVPDKPLGIVLVALLFVPLVAGPSVGGASRWIGMAPILLTTSLLCLPPLAVLTARAKRGWLVGGLGLTFLAGLLQPDGSVVLALGAIILVLGRINLASITKAVLVGGIGAVMIWRDRLEPVPFVEGVLLDAAASSPLAAGMLGISLIASFFLVWTRSGAPEAERSALMAALIALIAASLLGPFPTPLLGYGAASILGFALGLALMGREVKAARQ